MCHKWTASHMCQVMNIGSKLQSKSSKMVSSATVLVQRLSLFSLLPLLCTFWRLGKLRVFFISRSRFGVQLSNALYRVGVMDCYASAIAPEKLNPVDSSHSGEHGGEHVMQTRVHFELSKLNQLLL